MIQASEQFKQAVRDGKPQRALLRFGDTVFTQKDISITSGGLTFTERFNESTDLQIGSCPSSTLRVSLINRDGILDNYKFGRFVASLGALVDIDSYKVSGNVTASYNNGEKVFVGQDATPYLLENGQACKVQPAFAVKGIVIDGDTLYAIGDGRKIMAFSVSSYATKTVPTFDETAWVKLDAIASDGTGVTVAEPYIHEWWRDGIKETYEYCKLGTFIAPRPAVVKKRIIDMEANDQMTLFEDKWARDISVGYPTTLSKLLTAICGMVDVKLKSTTFPNSSLEVDAVPDAFEEATLSEVVYWIAEAAGCIARFDRDGLLELTWFNQTDAVFDEHDYSDFTPLSYQVEPISQLHVRNQDSYEEAVVGSGDNAYMIQDNPFLRQNDEQKAKGIALLAETNSETNTIYNRLASFKPFNPSSVDLFSDWTIQAGDIVTVKSGDDPYSLPVYSATTIWRGSPKVTLESTGNETREPISELKRQQFSSGRRGYGHEQAIESLEEKTSWAEIVINEQKAQIELNAGQIQMNGEQLSQAIFRIDGAEANIQLWAERTENNEQQVSQAIIEIDGANARIDLQAKRIDNAENDIKEAGVTIDGVQATVREYSGKVDEQGKLITGAQTQIDGINQTITQQAGKFDELGKLIEGAVFRLDGLESDILLKADQSTVSDIEKRTTQAEIDINGAKGQIALKASQEYADYIHGSLQDAWSSINVLADGISLKANQTEMDEVHGSLINAWASIDILSERIELRVTKEEFDRDHQSLVDAWSSIEILSTGISQKVGKGEIISEINQTPETVKIIASRIDLSGYVTASQLSAVEAKFGDYFSGTGFVSALKGGSATFDNFYGVNMEAEKLFADGFTLARYAVSWKSSSIPSYTLSSARNFVYAVNNELSNLTTVLGRIVTETGSSNINYLGR